MTKYPSINSRCSSKSGVTLLELLTVMCIMAFMSTMVYAAYHWISRGYALRSAVWHISQSLNLARQSAIMQGKRVFVVFEQDGTNAWYSIVKETGIVTVAPSMAEIRDEYGDFSELSTNTSIYFFRADSSEAWDMVRTTLASVYSSGGDSMDCISVVSIPGDSPSFTPKEYDSYGWELYPRTVMPKGIQYGRTGTKATAPVPIVFAPNGTTPSGVSYEIDVAEKVRVSSSDPYSKIKVAPITGFVEIEYDKTW